MQNKKNRSGVIFIFMSFFLLLGCNEDLGNYNYSEINEIVISGIEESYTFVVGEMTHIKPELQFTLAEEQECGYEWLLLRTGEENKPYLLATTKNLEIPVSGKLGELGEHICYYVVTNPATGISYTKGFKIQVTTEFNLGYLILNDVNNRTRLDLLANFDSELTLYTDLITLTGSSMPTDGKPRDVVTYVDTNSPILNAPVAQRYAVVVLTDKGIWRLDPATYHYSDEYSMSYIILNDDQAVFPNGHVAEKLISFKNNTAYLLANDNWLYYFATGSLAFNLPINVMLNSDRTFKPAPYLMDAYVSTIFFNEDTQSFVSQTVGTTVSGSTSSYMQDLTEQANFFPLLHINERNLEFICMGNKDVQQLAFPVGYIFFKDTQENDYYLGRLNLYPFAQQAFDKIIDSEGAIGNAKFYAYHPGGNDYLFFYYATETAVYELQLQHNAGNQLEARKVYEAPAGHQISMMKYVYPGSTGSWYNSLLIATYDPSDTTGEKGTLGFYESTPISGGLSLAQYNEKDMFWTGFGKIVGVDYKTK